MSLFSLTIERYEYPLVSSTGKKNKLDLNNFEVKIAYVLYIFDYKTDGFPFQNKNI